MERPPDDTDDQRAHALAGELRIVLGQLIRKLREQNGPEDFTWSQKSVLSHLERDGPTTVTSLARIEGVRSQSMGATVSFLENAGLVARGSHPSDRRQTLLCVTPAGRDLILARRTAREDWLFQAMRKRLSPDDAPKIEAAVSLLKQLLHS